MSTFGQFRHRLFTRLSSRQFFVFLFFLFISASFWFFQAFNEVYEEDFDVSVEVKNVPESVVLISDLSSTVRVRLKDRGIVLLGYKYGKKLPPLVIGKQTFDATEGSVRIGEEELANRLKAHLSATTQVVDIKPDMLEVFYNHGRSKRVPVRLLDTPSAAEGYAITQQRLEPDSVLVYAAKALLDTLSYAGVHAGDVHNINSEVVRDLKINGVRAVKFVPAVVKLTAKADRLVERVLSVPVKSLNFPENMVLRTFPATIDVVFQVSMSAYRNIKPEQFSVVVDYASLPTDGATRCPVRLETAPAEVLHPRPVMEEVEYVLEKRS